MPSPVALVGVDSAGGTITGPGASQVRINGVPVALLGDRVASHGNGSHSSASMVEASTVVRINGVGIVRAGDAASCGHAATGSTRVRIP